MEHVSTLCAVSTVGIAATGFALGRVDQPSSKLGRFRKNTLAVRDHGVSAPNNNISPYSAATTPQSSHFPPVALNPESSHITEPTSANEPCVSAEIPSGGQLFRRKSSFAGVILRRRGYTLTSSPSQINQESPTISHFRRPSSSWLRRLSIQPSENRPASQGPWSPLSNGPASPDFSRPSSQRRITNKLVKRPPSQHANTLPSSPLAPSFTHRPATSYQRSEALRHRATHSLNFEPNFLVNSPSQSVALDCSSPRNNNTWQPYLKSSVDRLAERLARRLSATPRPREHTLRRILPSSDVAPTLVLATAITSKEPVKGVGPDDSAPSSPVQFRNPFKSIDFAHARDAPSPMESEDSPSPVVLDEADPKSPAVSSSTVDTVKLDHVPLIWPKRRAVSTPVAGVLNPKATLFDTRQLNGKRNITDPNVFRRPPTLSQTKSPDFLTSNLMGSRRYTTHPRLDLGLCRDGDHRPFTSDAVALSAYRNGSFRSSGSTFSWSFQHRPKRHSIAASDPASTAIGSDDTRIFTSGEEDDIDFLTDTAFDSIRTHITSGSDLGFQGPRIDSIFDRSSTDGFANTAGNKYEEIIPRSSTAPRASETCLCGLRTSTSPLADARSICQERADLDGGEDSRISFPSDLSEDEDACSMVAALPSDSISSSTFSRRLNLSLKPSDHCFEQDMHTGICAELSRISDQTFLQDNLRVGNQEHRGLYPKMNIFDWSEQSRNDREVTGSDERPRTVHGKHGPEMRGSRPPGRRAPNPLHLRSQSVPVTRDPIIANESRQNSGKFGTWGLGSKGVSEDWDSDFEFDDVDGGNETLQVDTAKSQQGMVVPAAILERQASLHGQFGQVQELTLLVEELKRLRHRASYLNIVQGPSNELWKEAEGIVNLATLDDDDNNDSPPRSPSSLTFSFDDSEGESSNAADAAKRGSGDSWRASLPEEKLHPNLTISSCSQDSDTSTKAKTVLDLIYQQRVSHDPAFGNSHLSRSKKLPFDTQSLRDLVIRAGTVTRSLKEVIRTAEGVMPTPENKPMSSDPPFSRIFDQPVDDDHLIYETRCIN